MYITIDHFVSEFALHNSEREHQLTTSQFKRCVTLFLYNLKNPKTKT